MRAAAQVIADHIKETGVSHTDMLVLLAEWFDEHDSVEALQEFLVFCSEENDEH